MTAQKRTLLFKIIITAFFGFVILFLVTKIYDFVAPANSDKAYQLNKAINNSNQLYSKNNSFGFTDKERTPKKPKGIYRIAVIGDSFIWGDGLPYPKVWSHKLETKLLTAYDSIEVISWGKCGWSTLDEFNFFKQHGKDFDIDLLIIGWVDNDPDIGEIPQVNANDAANRFPFTYKISPAFARFLLNNSTNDVYNAWINAIYSNQNLNNYQKVLTDFHNYLTENKVQSIMVMTPAGFSDDNRQRFTKAQPLITNAGFTCVNLFDPLKKKLEHYTPAQLQANPANMHPGDVLTEQFATEVQQYIQQNNYLQRLHKKGK